MAPERGAGADEGMTLVELMVTVALLSVVVGIFLSVLVSVQNHVAREERRQRANDQVRLAIQQLDREVRSGNVFRDPAAEPNNSGLGQVGGGMGLRIYTHVHALHREERGMAMITAILISVVVLGWPWPRPGS